MPENPGTELEQDVFSYLNKKVKINCSSSLVVMMKSLQKVNLACGKGNLEACFMIQACYVLSVTNSVNRGTVTLK